MSPGYLWSKPAQSKLLLIKYIEDTRAKEKKSGIYNIALLALLSACSLTMISCVYNSEEDLAPPSMPCNTDGITYSGDILPLLENRCFKCHADAIRLGNIVLEGYDNVKLLVDSGRLLGAVRQDPGFSPMPQNEGRLPQCDIAIIADWINEGAPNN